MRAATVLALALSAAVSTLSSAQALSSGPPLPFEDAGACPFEGCTYGQWTAKQRVVVRRERRTASPIAFRVPQGSTVTALTGVVVTRKPGRVRFRVADELESRSGTVRVKAGGILYLLTYQGEGFTKAWFDGRLYDSLDGTDFFNAVCDSNPGRCTGRLIEKPTREWWVQVRDAAGRVGWTSQPDGFEQPGG